MNDNAPRFEQEMYTVEIMENVTVPVVIVTVKATDADAGLNGIKQYIAYDMPDSGQVHYSLVSSNGGLFSVDYDSGEVRLRKRPSNSVTVQVRAKDSATPSLSSTVNIDVRLIDINDHVTCFGDNQRMVL